MQTKSLLEQLKEMTVVVADTGNLADIAKYRPRDVTTNPTLILQAVEQGHAEAVLQTALASMRHEPSDKGSTRLQQAVECVLVAFGTHILSLISGRVSTELDARLSHDTQASVAQARRLMQRYAAVGISRERVLIKIAATWEGMQAAQILEREGIHCNITLLFSVNQAVTAAAAGATLISPFVGRILDWHKKQTGRVSYAPQEDPGVQSLTQIYNHLKHEQVATEIMGASFRNIEEIIELAGCDLLTISPALLEELQKQTGTLVRKLDVAQARLQRLVPIVNPLDEEAFRLRHAQDRMATEKLAEGIQGFSTALETLERLLAARM